MHRFLPLLGALTIVLCVPAAGMTPAAEAEARERFAIADGQFLKGKHEIALESFARIVSRFPLSDEAPRAQLRIADAAWRAGANGEAFDAYQTFVERFPKAEGFNRAVESQFTIARRQIAGARTLALTRGSTKAVRTMRESGIVMLRKLLASAKHAPFSAEAHYLLAVTLDENTDMDNGGRREAFAEFEELIQTYPDSRYAAASAFQLAFIPYRSSFKERSYDATELTRARAAFEDFLTRYPNSERSPEARHRLALIDASQTKNTVSTAGFYQRTGQETAAAATYNEALLTADTDEETKRIREKLKQLPSSQPNPLTTSSLISPNDSSHHVPTTLIGQ